MKSLKDINLQGTGTSGKALSSLVSRVAELETQMIMVRRDTARLSQSSAAESGETIHFKIVPIGSWMMGLHTTKSVGHGLDYTKIKAVAGYIVSDNGISYFPLGTVLSEGHSAVYLRGWAVADISLGRLDGSIFANMSGNYMSATVNRGGLIIWYTD